MSAMSPLEAAFVTEAIDRIDKGADSVNMRDGHSAFWGADELCKKLERTDHEVEWNYNNTKLETHHNHELGVSTNNLIKDGGANEGWDDGFLVTKLANINGIRLGQAVDGCHIRFGMTADNKDSSLYEHGFYVGIYPDKKVFRGCKGEHEYMARYDLNETFTAQIIRGGVCVLRNDEEEPFDVIGPCIEEGTSMYGMIHIMEKDAIGQIEGIWAVAMVKSLDINGNMLTDGGVDRLAEALELGFTKIEYLDLGLNRMQDRGCIRIAEVIEKSVSKIKSLVLSHNEIGDEGLIRLSEALEKAGCKVSKLWLTDNQIADAGAIRLAEALEKETCQIDLLEIAWNKIEDEGAQRLLQAISAPECKITYFTIDHNKWTDKKTRKMLTMLLAKVPRLIDMVTLDQNGTW